MKAARTLLKKASTAFLILALLGLGIRGVSAILSQGFSFTDFADHFLVQPQGDGLLGA